MDEATQFLLDNQEQIIKVLHESDNSPTKAFKRLEKELPAIKGLMSDRSFRSMVKLLPAVSNCQAMLDNKIKALSDLEQRLTLAETGQARLTQELQATKALADKMAQALEQAKAKPQVIRQQLDNKAITTETEDFSLKPEFPAARPVNIAGWTVRQRPNGFYYLYKTTKGKTKCLYLGKRLDKALAKKKIQAYEQKNK